MKTKIKKPNISHHPASGINTQIRQRRILSLTGFTLLELLVVVIILGVLAAIAIPIYTNVVEQKRGEVCINNMRVIFAAWRIYSMKGSTYPATANSWTTLQTVSQINTRFNIQIDGKYFGSNEIPGFYFQRGGTGTDAFYWIWGYRLGTISSKYINCKYYYDRTSSPIYDWTIVGPWVQADE